MADASLEPRLLGALSRILLGLPDAGPTLTDLLEFCARELEPLVPQLNTTFAFAHGSPPSLVVRAAPRDSDTSSLRGEVLVPSDSTIMPALSAHETQVVPLSRSGQGATMASLAAAGFQTLLMVPLLDGGELLGSWNLASKNPDAFGDAEIALLARIGDVVALAATRAHLHGQVARQTEQLVESEKLAVVGRLIAGVAHELGGPLQAIISLAEVLSRAPDRDDRAEAANRIIRSALRCRGMVKDLLTYARKHPHSVEPVQVSDAIMDALELDRFSDVGEVQVHVEGTDDVPPVLADNQRLTQVFLNLITNARHATAQDGRPGLVRIRVSAIDAGASQIDLSPDSQVVRVAVEDDGPGVSQQVAETMFEPFVTTKPVGSGTGLGLSVSRSLIMDMGGALYLDGSFSPGARFVVELPSTSSLPTPISDEEGVRESRGLRILLLDDDREILETYEAILALDDHQVTSCDRGKKALAILETEDFDVILCDVRLPDIRGTEFLQRLRAQNPECVERVIFATGDVVNDETRAFLASVPNQALIKPFLAEDLQRAISRIPPTTR